MIFVVFLENIAISVKKSLRKRYFCDIIYIYINNDEIFGKTLYDTDTADTLLADGCLRVNEAPCLVNSLES